MTRFQPRAYGLLSLALFGIAGLLCAFWAATSGTAASASTGNPRAVMPGLARDGYFPTPTPTPTPSLAKHCYAPRDESGGFTLRPSGPKSVFRNCQVIAFYGVPGVPGMGVLGQYPDSATMLAALKAQAAQYDDVNAEISMPYFRPFSAG